MSTSTVPAVNVTAVSLAVAVMHKAAAAEAKAAQALDRARGSTWDAVREAALCFDAPMSDEDRTALSGELAREYEGRYKDKAAAKSAASQHAKAIFALTHGKGSKDAKSLKEYLAGAFVRNQANAGNAPKNQAAQTVAASSTSAPASPEPAAQGGTAFSTAGMPVEVGSAIIRLITAAKKNAAVGDALCVLANQSPDRIVAACEWLLTSKAEGQAAKLAEKFGQSTPVKKAA